MSCGCIVALPDLLGTAAADFARSALTTSPPVSVRIYPACGTPARPQTLAAMLALVAPQEAPLVQRHFPEALAQSRCGLGCLCSIDRPMGNKEWSPLMGRYAQCAHPSSVARAPLTSHLTYVLFLKVLHTWLGAWKLIPFLRTEALLLNSSKPFSRTEISSLQ